MPARVSPTAVFLNIPYDHQFRSLYLAYIVGLMQLGLEPRVTLGLPGGARRLDRILELIQGCRYSLHDLSRVELDAVNPPTPRFNMPFELGLSVCWAQLYPKTAHLVRLRDCKPAPAEVPERSGRNRPQRPWRHGGGRLGNAFVRPTAMPTVAEMMASYRIVQRQAPAIQRSAGAASLFEAKVFKDLCLRLSAPRSFPKADSGSRIAGAAAPARVKV